MTSVVCLIEGGLRRNQQTKEATDSEIHHQIAKFLRGAVDRQGGRQRRKDAATTRKAVKTAAASRRKQQFNKGYKEPAALTSAAARFASSSDSDC